MRVKVDEVVGGIREDRRGEEAGRSSTSRDGAIGVSNIYSIW